MGEENLNPRTAKSKKRIPPLAGASVILVVLLAAYVAAYYMLVDRAVVMKPDQPVRWTTQFRKLPERARGAANVVFQPVHHFDRRHVRKDYWYDYSSFASSIKKRAEKKP